jgi:REP element-mobilizing transposase RayT
LFKNEIISTKYKPTTTEEAYFITITTVGWIDVFTRLYQKYNIISALKYCQENKGLEIYSCCLMPSHRHLLSKGTNGVILSDIMRDFKKHTSKQILKTIIEEPESRREWMLEYFKKSCEHLKREQQYKIWQDGCHAEIVETNWFIK